MRKKPLTPCVNTPPLPPSHTTSDTLVAHRREAIDQAAQALLEELHHWKTAEQIHAEHPMLASIAAIRRDTSLRFRNGLAELDAVRMVGNRCFIHTPRYLAWRFGERA